MSIPRVMRFVLDEPWAILPGKLEAIVAVVLRHDAGVTLSPEEIRAAMGGPAGEKAGPRMNGVIAVLPLLGSLFPRANMVTEDSGGTSLQRFTAQFRALVQDPAVKAIVLDVDSPGGSIQGATEAATAILAARGSKPIVAVANVLMASAAYHVASAADEIVASPSARLGSIGVFTAHVDRSAALAAAGEKVTMISAGEGKVDGHDAEPLSDETRAKIQRNVDQAYGIMVRDIANGRAVTADVVRGTWKAGIYFGAEAKALGLADRVATMDETLARLASGSGRAASMRGSATWGADAVGEDPAPAPVAEDPAPVEGDAGEAERRLRAARMSW